MSELRDLLSTFTGRDESSKHKLQLDELFDVREEYALRTNRELANKISQIKSERNSAYNKTVSDIKSIIDQVDLSDRDSFIKVNTQLNEYKKSIKRLNVFQDKEINSFVREQIEYVQNVSLKTGKKEFRIVKAWDKKDTTLMNMIKFIPRMVAVPYKLARSIDQPLKQRSLLVRGITLPFRTPFKLIKSVVPALAAASGIGLFNFLRNSIDNPLLAGTFGLAGKGIYNIQQGLKESRQLKSNIRATADFEARKRELQRKFGTPEEQEELVQVQPRPTVSEETRKAKKSKASKFESSPGRIPVEHRVSPKILKYLSEDPAKLKHPEKKFKKQKTMFEELTPNQIANIPQIISSKFRSIREPVDQPQQFNERTIPGMDIDLGSSSTSDKEIKELRKLSSSTNKEVKELKKLIIKANRFLSKIADNSDRLVEFADQNSVFQRTQHPVSEERKGFFASLFEGGKEKISGMMSSMMSGLKDILGYILGFKGIKFLMEKILGTGASAEIGTRLFTFLRSMFSKMISPLTGIFSRWGLSLTRLPFIGALTELGAIVTRFIPLLLPIAPELVGLGVAISALSAGIYAFSDSDMWKNLKEKFKDTFGIGKPETNEAKVPFDSTVIPDSLKMDRGAIKSNEIIDYFVKKGLSPEAGAAIAANVYGESKNIPSAINEKSGASGLFQYLGSRKNEFIEKYHMRPDQASVKDQLDFAYYEMFEKKGGYSSLGQELKNLRGFGSEQEGANKFLRKFEAPSEAEIQSNKIEKNIGAYASKLLGEYNATKDKITDYISPLNEPLMSEMKKLETDSTLEKAQPFNPPMIKSQGKLGPEEPKTTQPAVDNLRKIEKLNPNKVPSETKPVETKPKIQKSNPNADWFPTIPNESKPEKLKGYYKPDSEEIISKERIRGLKQSRLNVALSTETKSMVKEKTQSSKIIVPAPVVNVQAPQQIRTEQQMRPIITHDPSSAVMNALARLKMVELS